MCGAQQLYQPHPACYEYTHKHCFESTVTTGWKRGSDFIWDFGKLPFPSHLGKYFIKSGKISAKIHEIGKIKANLGFGMTPI